MKRLLTSCFGLGLLAGAPGTFGSLPPTIIFFLCHYFGSSSILTLAVFLVLVLAGSVVCIKFAPVVIAATGNKDPREVVADEFAGQAAAFLLLSVITIEQKQIAVVAILGFLLFRVFDIVKPWPIRKLEKFAGGWGILADDLMAGVYAGAILLGCLKVATFEHLSSGLRIDDSSLNIFSAAFLGTVQGLTEFLPVSSSGHLVLFEHLFGLEPQRTEMLLFDLAAHIGTLLAIFIVFRKSIAAFVKDLLNCRKYAAYPLGMYKKSPAVHLLVLAAAATAVTAILGLLFEKYFALARGSLLTVAGMWLVTATLLIITDQQKKTKRGLRQFGIIAAVIVGIAQAAAIMPGISRSGATICAAILIGLRRRWAIEFSFLIAVPAIVGAAALQTIKNIGQIDPANLSPAAAVTGALAAAVVGVLALKLLIKTTKNANLKFFAIYCYILAALVAITT